MRRLILLALLICLMACAHDPVYLKYKNATVEIDQRAARGEISQNEADNLKMHAEQEYRNERRREEELLGIDPVSQQIKSQNQEINAVLTQNR